MPTTYNQTVSITTVSALTLARTVATTLSQNLTTALVAALYWTWGRTLTDHLTVHQTDAEKTTYHVTDTEVIRLASALARTFPAVLAQNLTVHQAQTAALGVTVLQRLKLIEALSPTNHYHIALVEALLTTPALAAFWGATLSQNLTVHPVLGRKYVTSPILAQNLTIGDGTKHTLVLRLNDVVDLTPEQIVNMIYKGDPLIDRINMAGLYVSPGEVAAFAINTRTNAVTEYTNYNFNSFAQFYDNRYVAAGPAGIYELDGDTDAGTTILADIISGYMQLNQTKLSGLKGVYVAMRGEGQFFLKLIAGDKREYVYQLQTQPGVMNTKVNIGKGLRTRYLAFQLTAIDGADFDLDTLEFVPMLSSRRV